MQSGTTCHCPGCKQPTPVHSGPHDLLQCSHCRLRFVAPDSRSVSVFTRSPGMEDEFHRSLQVPASFRERFILRSLLGAGGLGCVYLATDRSNQALVAVKILIRSDRDQIKRFQREGEILLRIRHPHVVPVYEVGTLDDHPYLVMEYVSGGTLRSRMSAARVSLEDCLLIMRDILLGLQELHSRGIVHRDLKPENILILGSGRAMIADLGLAKDYADSERTATRCGIIMGTPKYMAPEQVLGEPAAIASDIYSMGILSHELLVGKYPFEYSNIMQLLHCHQMVDLPAMEPLVPGLPPRVAEVVRRATAKQQGTRPQSAADFLVPILRSLKPGTPVSSVAGPNSTGLTLDVPASTDRRRDWRTPAWLLAVLLTVGMGVGAFHPGRAPDLVPSPSRSAASPPESPRPVVPSQAQHPVTKVTILRIPTPAPSVVAATEVTVKASRVPTPAPSVVAVPEETPASAPPLDSAGLRLVDRLMDRSSWALETCHANWTKIRSAMDMYNLDRNANVTTITREHLELLASEGYLKGVPVHPGREPNSWVAYYRVRGDASAACRIHGDLNELVHGR